MATDMTLCKTIDETRNFIAGSYAAFFGSDEQEHFDDAMSLFSHSCTTLSDKDCLSIVDSHGKTHRFWPSVHDGEAVYAVYVYPSEGISCGECRCRCGYNSQNCSFAGVAVTAPAPESSMCREIALLSARRFNEHFGTSYTASDFARLTAGQLSLF